MSLRADLFETMGTMRAMRRLKPDPIPDAVVHSLLEAALTAPNGGNRQNWRFIVVKDPAVKRGIQPYYKRGLDEVVADQYRASEPPPGVTRAQYDRQLQAVIYLTEHFHEAPVWIVACLDEGTWTPTRSSGASIYPAVQNILLAARAHGLGACLTTRHVMFGDEVDAVLGLPPGVRSYAIVPLGYPMGRLGPVRRRPVSEVTYADRWGSPYPGKPSGV